MQRFWRDRLQPWIVLANLPDNEETLHKEFTRQFSTQLPSRNTLESLSWRMTGYGLKKQPRRSEELIHLYRSARAIFERLRKMSEEWEEFPFALTYFIRDDGRGRISFQADPQPDALKQALNGCEIARIRRCPFEDCGRFFYAVRSNTGACWEHLARARVARGRDPELRRKYEQTRRINRLVREELVPLEKAIAKIKNAPRKRRIVQ